MAMYDVYDLPNNMFFYYLCIVTVFYLKNNIPVLHVKVINTLPRMVILYSRWSTWKHDGARGQHATNLPGVSLGENWKPVVYHIPVVENLETHW
jgi:hypothetical protein